MTRKVLLSLSVVAGIVVVAILSTNREVHDAVETAWRQ